MARPSRAVAEHVRGGCGVALVLESMGVDGTGVVGGEREKRAVSVEALRAWRGTERGPVAARVGSLFE
ncbi:hypothetical protein RO07_20090 [Pandoraea pulmonicola]|uniref:Uncharacterized protein n=1 Tax=Pandoraea pulmonicola TaxID=93221 RepID=A0ABM5S374_PANPU|nr:hypothetical protein RO07_00185 [Pandoraea pulmonicola]AJC22216.1 hypothetical protein RO07_20090 [Pandoraea pulmonicola]